MRRAFGQAAFALCGNEKPGNGVAVTGPVLQVLIGEESTNTCTQYAVRG